MKTLGKKIFLIWADNGPEIVNMISDFKKNGHEVVYWVGLKENTSGDEKIIFQDHYDAWLGKPASKTLTWKISPPSSELIKKMAETESIVLTMMNKKFDSFSVDERRHIYYQMLGYWNEMINRLKPDIIIFPIVPHTVYNYIIYYLARSYGIKTLMFEDSWVSDRLLKYNDWQKGSKNLKAAIEKNCGENFSVDDLSPDVKDYYERQTDPTRDSTPVYITHFKKNSSRLNVLKKKFAVAKETFRNGTFLRRLFFYFFKINKTNLKKEYQSVVGQPDFSKDFIYVTLSFQPERTSSPQGDVFVDQILMIETISASLPVGWLAYVKEHPTQWLLRSGVSFSSSRYFGYYRRIAKLSNVVIMPIETDTYELMMKAKAVAACAGTAGWEGIMRGKPMLNFGYPWYRDCPAALRVKDVESCRTALEKIKKGFKPDKQLVINFLKSFDETTIHGYIEGMVAKISKLNKKESAEKITQLLLKELEEI